MLEFAGRVALHPAQRLRHARIMSHLKPLAHPAQRHGRRSFSIKPCRTAPSISRIWRISPFILRILSILRFAHLYFGCGSAALGNPVLSVVKTAFLNPFPCIQRILRFADLYFGCRYAALGIHLFCGLTS